MSQFGRALGDPVPNRKLSHEELVRAIRYMINAEQGAVQLYREMAQCANNPQAEKVLTDIANEEKEHTEKLLHLLRQLAPEEEKSYEKGCEEAEEVTARLKQ